MLGEGAAASDLLQLSGSHSLCILTSSCWARKAVSLLGDLILGGGAKKVRKRSFAACHDDCGLLACFSALHNTILITPSNFKM